MKGRPVPRESEILKQCLQYLQLIQVPCWRANCGAARFLNKQGGERLVRFGAPGTADVLGVIPRLADGRRGVFLACETKRPGKHPTELQSAFLASVAAAGGVALCVHSLEELREGLRLAGVNVP